MPKLNSYFFKKKPYWHFNFIMDIQYNTSKQLTEDNSKDLIDPIGHNLRNALQFYIHYLVSSFNSKGMISE